MKNFTLTVCVFISVSCVAQFRHINFSLDNNVSNALSKVVEDYPDHFNNIRGEMLDESAQGINYSSTINIEGADSAIIMQTGNGKDGAYSWKEIVFESDDFDEAKSKFHSYFNKIKSTSSSIHGKSVNFNATYEMPDDSKRFTSILFTAHPETGDTKNLVIDLHMQYVLDGWQISINIYEHRDYGVDDDNAQTK